MTIVSVAKFSEEEVTTPVVNLPKVDRKFLGETAPRFERDVFLTVRKKGGSIQYFIGRKRVSDLCELGKLRDCMVVIRADGNLYWNEVLKVAAKLQEMGVARLKFSFRRVSSHD
jgi:biopolymer transport protein ExbD